MSGKILWIEDDPDDVFLIGRAIRKAGLDQPALARDGQEAVDYLSGSGSYADRNIHPFPKLVLLDLKLPKRSGFEVLQWIRDHEETSLIPVVVFTSSKERADVDQAYRLGANAYLLKSVDHEHVVKALQSLRTFWLDTNLAPSPPSHEIAALSSGPDNTDGRGV